MTGVAEYEPDDLTIGVAGGTPIRDLRARVAASNQRAPLDSPGERATVGGTLARAAAGPMRRVWGTPRRQVLGVELVTGDGRILRVGGRVVKNVAGYDLNKLITGSAGTLGVITRAHLRLLPAPAATATAVLTARDRDALVLAAHALLDAPVQPAALELVDAPWRLIARYEGSAPLVAEGVRIAGESARDAGGAVTLDDDALDRVARMETEAAAVIRVASLPARLVASLAVAERVSPDARLAAHAGDGIVRVLIPADAAGDVASIVRAIDEARRETSRGTVVVERGPAALMRALDPWGPVPEGVRRLSRELALQFDPAGILQRGRWIA